MNDRARILIVDADEGTRKTLTLFLRKKGYEAEAAATGQEALDRARKRAFNLALLDVRLPDVEGVDLIAPLREVHSHLAVIMVTDYASVRTAVQALDEGASGYITKPLDVDQMLATIKGTLESQRLAEDKRGTERALKEAEARLRGILSSIPGRIFVFDREGWFTSLYVFPEEELYALQEQFVGRKPSEVMPPHVDEMFSHAFARNKQGEVAEFDFQLAVGDQVSWYAVKLSPVFVDGEFAGSVAAVRDITEHKQAEAALQQCASQLTLLDEIGRRVLSFLEMSFLDLEQVLGQAAQLIQECFGFHHVALFTWSTGHDRLVMRARAGEFAHLFPGEYSVAPGQGMVGWVGRNGETLLANDVNAEPRYVNPFPDRLPTRSELSVPIRIGDEVVGVLDLQSPEPNAFDRHDLMTMETLTSLIAVAIHNVRCTAQAAQRNRELTLLNRVISATTVAAGEGLEPALEAVCRELALAFQVPQVAAALFNKEKTEATVVAEYLAPGRHSCLGATIPAAGNAASQHLLAHKTPLVIDDAQTDSRLASIHDLVHRQRTVSLLLLPLMADGEVVGSLIVDAVEPRGFSAEEVNLAWRVAEQVSAVLAQARLREEHRQLEEQFQQAQKMEAVGRLAGGVAHDFNNLLTVIHLSTRLMERKLHPQDPLLQHVERIRDAGERATGLTRQLLAFSRREIVEPQVLDLNQVLAELDKMLRRLIGEDVELSLFPARELWPVKIDPIQVEQVVVNLAVNARDAMPAGGRLTLETANVVLDAAYTAHHLDAEPGEYVLLAVSDTGTGMSEEIKAHLFEPFFTTKEKGKGTGLGLATVFGIVKQNRGHIRAYSEVGQGTTFKIYLPRVAEGACTPLPVTTAGAALPGGSETLLLVEDETAVRELARDILAAQGYHVLTAKDGIEGLRVAREQEGPIHLLVTDVVMPRMSGKALADELGAGHPEMQVLFTSGYTDSTIVHHGVPDEGVHFLPKPFDLDTLVQKVRAVLDG